MDVRLPSWLGELPEDDRPTAKCRFLLRLAAVYFSPAGQLNVLSEALGLHRNSLSTYDSIPADMAVKLEALLGREHFPRELFRPDLFTVEG